MNDCNEDVRALVQTDTFGLDNRITNMTIHVLNAFSMDFVVKF